jgi:hypothetical protein
MGSACLLKNLNLADCCSNKSMVTNISKSDQVLTKDIPLNEESKEKDLKNKNIDNNNNKLSGILKYFNTEEKEILAEYYKQRDKEKNLTKNRDNGKYELMLKRLLEQKKIKRNGPKRRETIRNDKVIKQMVNEVISGNVKNKETKNNINEKENDLLIKNINDQKFRCSATIDRNDIMVNNLIQNSKKFNYKFYQYRNTINDIINESSGYSGLCQKQTKQSNSPKKKEIDNI